ncbi:MAG: hypothetical protein JNN18_11580 [Rubrivivax sp.]|nr:hypothetical protein [Rubrivivax sp.]
MWSRIASFAVWALAAAIAVFWGLRVFVQAPPAPVVPAVALAQPTAQADWTRLFGADAVPATTVAAEPPPDARFQLVGLVAPRGGGSVGVALIGVDGKPARAYRPGSTIDGALVLQAIQAREVTLGPAGGAPLVRLQMPPLPVAATGTLPAAGASPGATPQGLGPGIAGPRPGAPAVPRAAAGMAAPFPFGASPGAGQSAMPPAQMPALPQPPTQVPNPLQQSAVPDPATQAASPQQMPASGGHRRRLTTM